MNLYPVIPYLNAIILLTGASIGLRWLQRRWSLSLRFTTLLFVYLLKVIAGMAYGYIFLHKYNGDDTWLLNKGVEDAYQQLIHSPIRFFTELSPTHFCKLYPDFSTMVHMYTNELEYWMITKPLAFFYPLTGGSYYLNILVYNFISTMGLLLFYRWIDKSYKIQPKSLFFILFLMPSTLFWLSGLRADGYLFTCTIVFVYYFQQWLQKPRLQHIIFMIFGLIGIFILRNYLLLLLAPMVITLWLATKWKLSPFKLGLYIYGGSVVLFFLSGFCPKPFNLLQIVIDKQRAFFVLEGNTRYDIPPLEPSMFSFIKNLPSAISNGLFRPYLWEWKGLLQFLAAIDSMLLVMAILYAAVNYFKAKEMKAPPYIDIYLLMITGILLCVFIGYTVPFPGAVVRYKVIGNILILSGLIGLRSPKPESN